MRTEPRRPKMEALKRLNHVICPLASDLLAPLYEPTKIGGDGLIGQRAEPDSIGDGNQKVDRI
jgi:hypothetical protein